jgi:hypothetical protein
MFRTKSTHISHRKNLAKHSDLQTLGFSILKMSPLIGTLKSLDYGFEFAKYSNTKRNAARGSTQT